MVRECFISYINEFSTVGHFIFLEQGIWSMVDRDIARSSKLINKEPKCTFPVGWDGLSVCICMRHWRVGVVVYIYVVGQAQMGVYGQLGIWLGELLGSRSKSVCVYIRICKSGRG